MIILRETCINVNAYNQPDICCNFKYYNKIHRSELTKLIFDHLNAIAIEQRQFVQRSQIRKRNGVDIQREGLKSPGSSKSRE